MTSIQTLQTDILVLGSGGAGLFAALHAHQANPDLHITIAVKGLLGKCGCTRMVQGGYNVALAEGDSVERHFMDTIEGGKWLSDQELAWTLVTKSVERIRELENELGCFFDRNPDGTIHQKAFAGQTFDRTVHKGDLTGIEIINRLAEQVWARGIHRLEEHRAIELIKSQDGKTLAGVLMLNMRTGEFVMVRAKAVLLGTGGGPTMYKYHTPSGDKSCDGLAMALRAGLTLRDMEMVQFHPTGMLAGPDTRMTGTVLEEGLRGAGGYLLNGNKERFMGHYDPRNERATRDIVSRSIIYEMRAGRVTPNGGVYIQMHHLGPDNVRKLFKGMVERCADSGFDLANDLVEVVPTAHYMMGVWCLKPTPVPIYQVSLLLAKIPVVCMVLTALVATVWLTLQSLVASLVMLWRGMSWARATWRTMTSLLSKAFLHIKHHYNKRLVILSLFVTSLPPVCGIKLVSCEIKPILKQHGYV